MILTKIFQEPYCEIFLNESNLTIAKWLGFLKPDEVRKGCDIISDYMFKHRLTRLIRAHTRLKMLSKEVQEYLALHWFGKGLLTVA